MDLEPQERRQHLVRRALDPSALFGCISASQSTFTLGDSMFLFNDPKDISEVELVHDRALPAEASTGLPLMLTAILGVGGFALTANPIVGGALAALPAYALLKRLGKSFKDNAFERCNPGCIAHLIKTDRDMITWIESHGLDEVRSQLLLASKQGQTLTSCAKRTLKALAPDTALPPRRVDQFIDGYRPQQALPVEQDALPVGKQTMLGAIEVPSMTVIPDREVAQPTASQKSITDHYLSDLRSTFLCAPPRTGKGILAAQLMQGFKQRYPGGKLLTCTIKKFDGENWYWAFSDSHLNPENRTPAQQVSAARDIYAMVNDWEATKASRETPALLVIDEIRDTLNLLGAIAMSSISFDYAESKKTFGEWLLGVAISSATLNQCHHRFMLIISPVVSLAGLGGIKGVSKDALASFVGITLAAPKALQFATGDNGTFSAPRIDANDPRFMGRHCLAYCKNDKQWYPVPTMPSALLNRLTASNPELKLWKAEPDDRTRLETSFSVADAHPVEQFYHEDASDDSELAIRAEVKRFLDENSDGVKLKDFVNRCRKPVRGMSSDDVRPILERMTLEEEILEVGSNFFPNNN
jgi:hypothetical protein